MNRIRRLMDSSVVRLAGGYALVVAVLAGAWAWSLYGPLTDAVVRQQEHNLTAVAQSAALVTAESGATPSQVARQLVARTDLRLTIIAADGRVLADSDYDAGAMENHQNRPEVAQALAGAVGIDRRLSRTGRIEELYVAVPGSLRGSRVIVRVAQPITDIDAIASRSRRSGLTLLALALLVAVGVAIRLARGATAPIRALSRAADRMSAGDLRAQIPEVPGDLDDLASALDALRAQVQARIAALEAERHTLRATLDGLSEAVLLLEHDVVRFANTEYSRLFGIPAQRIEGLPLPEVGLPTPIVAALEERVGSGIASAVELPADPLGRTYRLSVSPLTEADGIVRHVLVITDVTERARLDRIRRDFVSGASHELKTPVAAIRLLADAAVTASDDGDEGAMQAFIAQIPNEAARLQQLVTDLLELSRLESLPTSGAIADVRAVLERALVSHRGAAARKGLALESDLTHVAAEAVFVTVDPTDLAIVLDNLIDNAISYTDSGNVLAKVTTREDDVVIEVTDTGPGIPPEHQERVFERFYRVDSGRSREHGGTGLGLALVRHVAERAGGEVSLESAPAGGATFRVRLPRAV